MSDWFGVKSHDRYPSFILPLNSCFSFSACGYTPIFALASQWDSQRSNVQMPPFLCSFELPLHASLQQWRCHMLWDQLVKAGFSARCLDSPVACTTSMGVRQVSWASCGRISDCDMLAPHVVGCRRDFTIKAGTPHRSPHTSNVAAVKLLSVVAHPWLPQ